MHTYFEYFVFWLGFLTLLCCASALFYDCVYKPLRDKWVLNYRLYKLDFRLWWSGFKWRHK